MTLGCDRGTLISLRERQTNPNAETWRFSGVNSTAAKLLEAALEIVGTEKELARRLGIAETLLAKFISDLHPLPDRLLLRTVDIVLEHRQCSGSPLLAPVKSPNNQGV